MKRTRRCFGALLALLVVAASLATRGAVVAKAAALPDSDTALLVFELTITPVQPPVAFPEPATFSIRGACAQVAPAPSFVDVPPDEGTTCGQFIGSGSFTAAGCALGAGAGSASLTEPSGEVVAINGMTLTISGSFVLLEANQANGGYVESGSSGGDVVGIGVAVPVGPVCLGGPTTYAVTMGITALYLGGS